MLCPKCGESTIELQHGKTIYLCPRCDVPLKFFLQYNEYNYFINSDALIEYACLVRSFNKDRIKSLLNNAISSKYQKYLSVTDEQNVKRMYTCMPISRYCPKYVEMLLSVLETDFGVYNLKAKTIYLCMYV